MADWFADNAPAASGDWFAANAPKAEPGMLEPHHDWTDVLRGAAAGVKQLVTHPIDTFTQVPSISATPTPAIYGAPQAQQQAVDAQNKAVTDNAAAIRAQVQAAKDAPAFTAGAIAGPALLTHGLTKVVPEIPRVIDATADAAGKAKAKFYPTSQSVSPTEAAARNLSKSLVVSSQAAPSFIRAATDEAGTIVDYAQKNNLPINSKVDFAKAAQATADAVQSHFNEKILGPNADKVTAVPASYRGTTVGEGPNATLGSINDRIDAINQELNPNFRKGLASQTSAANVSDADLVAEKRALTNILHSKLAGFTGLVPEDIAGVRQQAGKLRTIADEASLSANQDTAAGGRQAMGATTSSVGTKAGIIDRALQFAQGGPEIIGNRKVNSAVSGIQPKPLNLPEVTAPSVAPVIRTPIRGGSVVVPGADYTPDPNAASVLRDRIAARQTAPSVAPVKGMQKWANDGAAKVVQHVVADPASGLTADNIAQIAATKAGRQLMIKASDLTPGSAAMKNVVQDVKAMLNP